MRSEPQEWIFKIEGDYRTARREMDHDDDSNYDAVCFHTQQCIEKYFRTNSPLSKGCVKGFNS